MIQSFHNLYWRYQNLLDKQEYDQRYKQKSNELEKKIDDTKYILNFIELLVPRMEIYHTYYNKGKKQKQECNETQSIRDPLSIALEQDENAKRRFKNCMRLVQIELDDEFTRIKWLYRTQPSKLPKYLTRFHSMICLQEELKVIQAKHHLLLSNSSFKTSKCLQLCPCIGWSSNTN